MTEEHTFRIHWREDFALDVTAADTAGAFRQMRAIVGETSNQDLPIDVPVKLEDPRTGTAIDLEKGGLGCRLSKARQS